MISRSALTPHTITVLSLIKKHVCQEIVGAYYEFILRTVDLSYNFKALIKQFDFYRTVVGQG